MQGQQSRATRQAAAILGCLRGTIDAVIHLCNTTHADFNGGFTLDDYPTYRAQPFRQQPTTQAETYY